MNHRPLKAALRLAVVIGLAVATFPVQAAALDQHDTSRVADINEAIQAFETDVGSALHNLRPEDSELIESYAYVELNLEAAHERLNTVFMLVAVSIYMDSPSDQTLVLHVMHGQLLTRSKNYLNEKKDAIASMAVAHPENKAFADYATRANAVLGDRAIPLLDEFDQRIRASQP